MVSDIVITKVHTDLFKYILQVLLVAYTVIKGFLLKLYLY